MNNQEKELLAEIRKNPRKMQRKYLHSIGILEFIENLDIDSNWSIRDRIDYFLAEHKPSCLVCSKPAKINQRWCSITCRNKDDLIRASISKKNKENKISRSARMKKTLQKKYGVDSVQSIPSAAQKTKIKKLSYYKTLIEQTFDQYRVDLEKYSDKKYLSEICASSGCYRKLSEGHFNGMPIMTIHRHFMRLGFDPEFPKSSSMGEREIAEFVESLGLAVIRNDRTAIRPKEIDVYIPEKRIGIEYNGLYWHADDKNGLSNKLNLCNQNNITLLQFYEDEWILKRSIVESIILSKLGLTQRVFARNTTVKRVSKLDATSFLDDNHLQGRVVAGNHYGLYSVQNELLCIASVGATRFIKGGNKEPELLRFATKKNLTIVGGFTKLISHIKTELGISSILTYADLRYSSGDVYSKNGTYLHTTNPGYFWVDHKKNIRINRYATQKKRLSNLLGSEYDPTKSESENMQNAGYYKIWDCGNLLYRI